MSEGLCPPKPPVRRRLHPQAPDCFGLNPSSQLVIGYHWFSFLNQVRKESQTQSLILNLLRILSTNLTISQKNSNWKIVFSSVSAHCASFISIQPLLKGVCISLIGVGPISQLYVNIYISFRSAHWKIMTSHTEIDFRFQLNWTVSNCVNIFRHVSK